MQYNVDVHMYFEMSNKTIECLARFKDISNLCDIIKAKKKKKICLFVFSFTYRRKIFEKLATSLIIVIIYIFQFTSHK